MKIRYSLSLLCLMLLLISVLPLKTNVYGDNPKKYQEISSTAVSMCVLEAQSGRVLFGKNIEKKVAMASTTKIFTALTVLENCNDLSQRVQIDDRAVGIEGTSIYLRKGENLSVKELLLGMMLPSGNDAASALAYFVGGNIPNFCDMMQKTAQNAGAFSSSFKNPHGLDEEGHFTTAYDLAKVSAKALENPDFVEIVTTKSAVISGNNEVKSRYLKNKNKLLSSFEGCNGVKTGFTDNAGRCFVSSAKRDNMQVVCSVLNAGNMFEEAHRLMQKAFETYKMTELIPAYNIIKEIKIENGREELVKVYNTNSFSYPLSSEEKLYVNFIDDIPSIIKAPINKEQVVGKIKVYLEDELLFEDDVVTREAVKVDSLWSYIKDLTKIWK